MALMSALEQVEKTRDENHLSEEAEDFLMGLYGE
jgi:hypothetical protein